MRLRTLIALALLAGCVEPAPQVDRVAQSLTSGCAPITDFGATPDDATLDQQAIQDALDACASAGGGVVSVPPGVFLLGQQSWHPYAVVLAGGVELRGESRTGSVLRLDVVATTIRMFYTGGATEAALTELTLDGQKAAQTPNEQVHGVFADGSSRLRLERLDVHGFTGDGLYLYTGANDTLIHDVAVTANDRNGVTMGGALHGVTITDSLVWGNAAQQIDSEPGVPNIVSDVSVRGCYLGSAPSTDYVLTISGNGSATRGHDWEVIGNRLDGGIHVVWAERVAIVGNVIRNPNATPAVSIYRSSTGVVVASNVIEALFPTATSEAAVRIAATGVGNQPEDVVVIGNQVRIDYPSNFGIDVRGALRATVVGNTLRGAGSAAGYSGIRTRSTVAMRSVVISSNTLRNFGAGVTFVTDQPIAYSSVNNNVLDNGTTVGPTP